MIQKRTILVVEDQEGFRGMFTDLLKSVGYEVLSAKNGVEALAMMRVEPIDLVLLDIVMPEMNGDEVLEYMKGDEKLKNIPVVILSIFSPNEEGAGERRRGADAYFMKGRNTPKEIVDKVTELLQKHTAS